MSPGPEKPRPEDPDHPAGTPSKGLTARATLASVRGELEDPPPTLFDPLAIEPADWNLPAVDRLVDQLDAALQDTGLTRHTQAMVLAAWLERRHGVRDGSYHVAVADQRRQGWNVGLGLADDETVLVDPMVSELYRSISRTRSVKRGVRYTACLEAFLRRRREHRFSRYEPPARTDP